MFIAPSATSRCILFPAEPVNPNRLIDILTGHLPYFGLASGRRHRCPGEHVGLRLGILLSSLASLRLNPLFIDLLGTYSRRARMVLSDPHDRRYR